MARPLPLDGIRVHLAGSIPDNVTAVQADAIKLFVSTLAGAVFNEGGTLIHGSHPSLKEPLEAAGKNFVGSGGRKDALILVRAGEYATSPEHLAEAQVQRKYAAVQIIPGIPDPKDSTKNQDLVSMREWMAERCDVVVAIGGRRSIALAGVLDELEEALQRGKPGFVVAGFGGAVAEYVENTESIYSRLRNGLPRDQNQSLAKSADVADLVRRIVTQIKLLPLVRESIPRGRLFRILALDGGGLRGAFTAAVLAKWDDMLKSGGGNDLVKNFDMVAGTSTGAILAIGLGLGLKPRDMLDFYRNEGPNIFPKNRKLRHWLKSKHDARTLSSILYTILGSRKLSDACCRLVIPTVRAAHGQAEIITTPHSPDRKAFAEISAVNAALASSAAPTYFDDAVVDGPIVVESYLDGGVWANNPVLPAIAEAVRHLKIPLDRIDVLSVGTMGNETDFTDSLGKGKAGWALTSVDLFFAAQEHAAAQLANGLLSPARHLRVNQQTPTEIKLDDAEAIRDMALRGSNVGQDSFEAVRSRFLDGFHAPDWRLDNP